MQELSGKWQCSGDGMIYYIAQKGNNIFLRGDGGGNHNVGFGTVNPQEQSIILQWADMPDSAGYGNHSVCYLDASKPDEITKRAGCAAYAIGNFRKVK